MIVHSINIFVALQHEIFFRLTAVREFYPNDSHSCIRVDLKHLNILGKCKV